MVSISDTSKSRLLPFSAEEDGGNKVLRNRGPFIPESLL